MTTEKLVINAEKEYTTVTILEGTAPKRLDELAPLKINITGDIDAPQLFLKERIGALDILTTHVITNREKAEIMLVINETDPYKRGTITGTMEPSPIATRLGINQGHKWSTTELGQMFKMIRAHFPDKEENMKLVAVLKNFQATINSRIEKMKQENGSFVDSLSAEVQSNLPASFKLKIPAWKGGPQEQIEVEIYSTVDGKTIQLELWSPALEEIIALSIDAAIDKQMDAITEIAPGIVIIYK
jgi:hypothetical protein